MDEINKEPSFLEYLQDARKEFVDLINSQEWNAKLRTGCEDLLIAFDQMYDKLKENGCDD